MCAGDLDLHKRTNTGGELLDQKLDVDMLSPSGWDGEKCREVLKETHR
jgi:hypothetical protein